LKYEDDSAIRTILLDFSAINHIIFIVEYMGVRFCVTLRNKVRCMASG
jgi:hypothetical protein